MTFDPIVKPKPMSQAELVALLWREPFSKSLDEIAALTDGQIVALTKDYAQSGSEPGVSGGFPRLTKEHFVKTWRACGKTPDEIEAMWQADYGGLSDGGRDDGAGSGGHQ